MSKNCFNHFKPVKSSKSSNFPNLGLSWIIGVGPVWFGVLMSCSCLDDHRWPYQVLGHLLHPEWGVVDVIISVAADVGARTFDHVFQSYLGVSWANWTLEACLRGFQTLKNLRHGATGACRCSYSVLYWIDSTLIVVVTIVCFYSSWVSCLGWYWYYWKLQFVWFRILSGRLVVRECFMYYNNPIGSKWEL